MTLKTGFYPIPRGHLGMVVTYLEMTKPPSDMKDVPLADGVTLRRVNDPDLGWYRDLIQRVGEDWLWQAQLARTDDDLAQITSNPNLEISVVEAEGRAEGIAELDFRADGVCELTHYGLTKSMIGSGVGRHLMTAAIRRAFENGATRFYLHTCTLDSPQALDFYLRSGFKITKQGIEIMPDPRLNGVLPEDAAPQIPKLP